MANTIKIRNSGTPSAAPSSLEYGELALNYYDGTIYYKKYPGTITAASLGGGGGSSAAVDPFVNGGRLTLTSGTPVTTSDVTGSAVYFTPYTGSTISLYDGSAWQSVTLTEQTTSVGYGGSGLNFDVFAYKNGSSVALSTAQWYNDTSRSPYFSLTKQDGVWVRAGMSTYRYLGTFRRDSMSTTCDTAANRFLWNYTNRQPRRIFCCPGYSNNSATTSYTLSSTAWVELNSGSGSRIGILSGDPGSAATFVDYRIVVNCDTGAGGQVHFGVGVNSTSTSARLAGGTVNQDIRGTTAGDCAYVPAGYAYLSFIGKVVGGTTTVYADGYHTANGGFGDIASTQVYGWTLA